MALRGWVDDLAGRIRIRNLTRPMSVDGYHQTVELCGRVACGWLFCYRIICSMDIPTHDQESFAGAVGCLVADDGEIRDLSGQMFMDMLHMVA